MTFPRRGMSSFWEKSSSVVAWSAVNGVAIAVSVVVFPHSSYSSWNATTAHSRCQHADPITW